jgi:acetylcholinesterase
MTHNSYHPERLALRWVQKYISQFGGDPTKVTMSELLLHFLLLRSSQLLNSRWGESAGAASVASQMLTNGGNAEGLFRAGFMQSGSPLPIGDIANAPSQAIYDSIVGQVGCSGASDTLQCLKTVPVEQLKQAFDSVPGIFSYTVSHFYHMSSQ